MPSTTNGKVIFNEKIASGYPIPGRTVRYDATEQLDLDAVPLHGGVLVKTLTLSVDPYFRILMAEGAEVVRGIAGFGIGLVLRSEDARWAPGDHVYGVLPYQEYSVLPSSAPLRKTERLPGLPWSTYLGAAGMPGLTAYAGWKEYALQDGVIASAGSDDKVAFARACGADVAFNYKTADTAAVLKEHGPIDLYWDNVGGKTLESALENANAQARFLICGSIAGYNSEPYHPKNLHLLHFRQITLYGFTVNILGEKYLADFLAEVPPKLASGALRSLEDVVKGLERAGDAIVAAQKGESKGKVAVLVAEE
ncbi:hypothetical protein HDZ31DRAFT_47889 [Schizophyllum fasciatum]